MLDPDLESIKADLNHCSTQVQVTKYDHIFSEVGSAAFFSGPQYTIPQLCYCSAQNAITQCFQICQYAMRNAAISDTSATHNHSKEKIIQQTFIVFLRATFGCVKQRNHESLCGFFLATLMPPKKIMLQNKIIILIKIKITKNVFLSK
jgi:hypothetical protein